MVVYRATPPDVASGVRVGDVEYPGFPRRAPASRRRPVDQGRVLRAALRPGAQHADRRVRARRSRQRGEGDVRRQRVREAVQEEPHRDRRQVHQPRRAGDPRALAGAEDDAAAAGRPDMLPAFLRDQRRAAQDQRRPDRGAREEDLADAAVGRPVRPARQLAGRSERSPTTAPTSTRARRSTSRSTSASTSRSPRTCRSSRPTPARC